MFVIGRLFEPTLISRVTLLSGDRNPSVAEFHEVDTSTAHLTLLGSISTLSTRHGWGFAIMVHRCLQMSNLAVLYINNFLGGLALQIRGFFWRICGQERFGEILVCFVVVFN